jgi:hypothetical protein
MEGVNGKRFFFSNFFFLFIYSFYFVILVFCSLLLLGWPNILSFHIIVGGLRLEFCAVNFHPHLNAVEWCTTFPFFSTPFSDVNVQHRLAFPSCSVSLNPDTHYTVLFFFSSSFLSWPMWSLFIDHRNELKRWNLAIFEQLTKYFNKNYLYYFTRNK